MSTTSLVRTDSRSTLAPAASRQPSRQSTTTTSSPLTTVTSILPKLTLTPQKGSATTAQKTGTPQQQPSPAVSTPGQWQHPRMDEVIRRQSSTNFDGSNMRIIGLNVALMLTSFLVPVVAYSALPRTWLLASEPYTLYTLYLLRAFFTLNLALALAPLFRPQDACEDIPLTPAQRHHLGLPPMTRSATPQEKEQYVTPPRYSRSTTPQSSSSSMRALASDSPLSGRNTSPALDGSTGISRRSVSGSPFGSQRPASPLAAGLRDGAGEQRRRLSFQSTRSSPLGTSEFDAVGSIGTPTKSGKASVGLNSKWLYEKGRGSPRASMNGGLAGFGGSGSVFS
ncbi:hypothetical protein LTR36_004440 [Oleoguttula mirabilis]|uniref:Nucleoporin POM34 n=1 Tax=Oleoguttula mirabilis TaxID=1507867 RepID=A0AAV9JHB8_9PEZI|nr:hypothetical protein LTR36_004440 [Oleoguttula mirabilis]